MSRDEARVLVNGRAGEQLGVFDRGLNYGDGLFETIRLQAGRAPLWARHWARLQRGAARLALPLPEEAALWGQLQQVSAGLAHAIVRITLTRGVGERGYLPPLQAQPTLVVLASAAGPIEPSHWQLGVRLRLCQLRLAEQPALAGLKHLNRLEQVLARAEWRDPAIQEGLLRDQRGRVISATAANLFAVIGGQLCTPALDRCGVAGVARAEVLEHSAAQVRDIALDELQHASEVFLTNAVRGVLPVVALDGREWSPGPRALALVEHWQAMGFSMGYEA